MISDKYKKSHKSSYNQLHLYDHLDGGKINNLSYLIPGLSCPSKYD